MSISRESTLPAGSACRTEAIEIANRWRHILVQGPKEAIDKFLSGVDQRFSALGWSRDRAMESQLNRGEYQRNRFQCWISHADKKPRILLCLNRTTDRRVRGGTYDVLDDSGLADLVSAIQQALQSVLHPAASALGLKIRHPDFGPISRLAPDTAAAFAELAEAADGQWPFPASVEPVWRHLVVTAHRDDVALHPQELTRWFADNGWGDAASTALTHRFYAEAEALAQSEDSGR